MSLQAENQWSKRKFLEHSVSILGEAWSLENFWEIFSISLDYPHASAHPKNPSFLTVPTHIPITLSTRQVILQMLPVFWKLWLHRPRTLDYWNLYVLTPSFHTHPEKVLHRNDGDCLSKNVILRVDTASC